MNENWYFLIHWYPKLCFRWLLEPEYIVLERVITNVVHRISYIWFFFSLPSIVTVYMYRYSFSDSERSVDPWLDGFTDLEFTNNAKNPCTNFTDAQPHSCYTWQYINTYMYIMIHFTVSNFVLVQRFTGLCSKIYVYVYLY